METPVRRVDCEINGANAPTTDLETKGGARQTMKPFLDVAVANEQPVNYYAIKII